MALRLLSRRGRRRPLELDPAVLVHTGPVDQELVLGGGQVLTLGARTSTALVGATAVGLLEQLAEGPDTALLLADGADPLHPGLTIGAQIADALEGTRRAALDRATDLLERAGVPEPHERVGARPHALTALDRQRAQLALAVANRPGLVLGEDPAAGLSPEAAAAFAASLNRLQAGLGFTLVVAAPEQATVVRLVDEILVLGTDGVIERRRRRDRLTPQSSASSPPSSSSSST